MILHNAIIFNCYNLFHFFRSILIFLFFYLQWIVLDKFVFTQRFDVVIYQRPQNRLLLFCYFVFRGNRGYFLFLLPFIFKKIKKHQDLKMVDMTLFFFIKNTLIVGAVFWFLSFYGQNFFEKSENAFKNDFYECGFRTSQDLNFSLNFSFFYIATFIVMYDVELNLLIPALFNVEYFNLVSAQVFVMFLFFVVYSFLIDIYSKSIDWNF